MSSYTTLVNVDRDTPAKLAHFVSQLLPANSQEFYSECNDLIEKSEVVPLIKKILDQSDFLLAMDRDTDIEGCYQSLFSLMYTLGEASSETPETISMIVASLTSNTKAYVKLRLQILVILFNLTFVGSSKYIILNAIFKYAVETDQANLVAHCYSGEEEWSTTWQLSPEQYRELLYNASIVLEKSSQNSLALNALIKYLQAFGGEAYPAQVQGLISASVINAIKSPINNFSDRVALLEALSGQTQALPEPIASQVELLRILCDGSLEEFTGFRKVKANSFPQSSGIDMDDIERLVKLLTLCSLATSYSGKSIPFDAVKQALQVDADEVEFWVIDAIASGLMEGSIDQINSTITVNRYVHRSFGTAHWITVQKQLRQLIGNVSAALDTMEKH